MIRTLAPGCFGFIKTKNKKMLTCESSHHHQTGKFQESVTCEDVLNWGMLVSLGDCGVKEKDQAVFSFKKFRGYGCVL